MGSLRRTGAVVALGTLVSASAACQRQAVPLEPALVVSASQGPGLRRPGSHAASERDVHQGDVLHLRGRDEPFTWSGLVEGQQVRRDGPTLVVAHTPQDDEFWVFASDVREGVNAAPSSFVCSHLGPLRWLRVPCADALVRRLTLAGDSVGFIPCDERRCPLVVAGPSGVFKTSIDGLVDVRAVHIRKWDYLIASSRWSRGPGHTGTELVVLLAGGGLRRIATIPVAEEDARDPEHARSLAAQWQVTGEGIRVQGKPASRAAKEGRQRVPETLDEMWFVTSEGDLKRQSMVEGARPAG